MAKETLKQLLSAKLIVSDFDGTLVYLDSDWSALKNELQVLATTLRMENVFSNNLDLGLRRIRVTHGEKVFEEYCQIVTRYELAGFRTDNVNHAWIDFLRQHPGKHFSIFSANTGLAIRTILREASFYGKPFCDAYIVGKEDVLSGKPDAEGLGLAMCHFHCSPEEVVFIGDTPKDFVAGKVAGVQTFDISTLEF